MRKNHPNMSQQEQDYQFDNNEENKAADAVNDQVESGRASLSAHSNEQINEVMKEEQDDFAYDNMDKGSNKSF